MGNRLRIGGTLEISGCDDRVREAKIKWITESIPDYYPDLRLPTPENIWFGYRPCTPDGMPCIGKVRADSSILIATGHSMMGVSLAPATGRIVRDLLIDHHEVNKLLSPTRF
jgi:D-amino-acid dehydrogenase